MHTNGDGVVERNAFSPISTIAGCGRFPSIVPLYIFHRNMTKRQVRKKASFTNIGDLIREKRAALAKKTELEDALVVSKSETQATQSQLSAAQERARTLGEQILQANAKIIKLGKCLSSEKALSHLLEESEGKLELRVSAAEEELNTEKQCVRRMKTSVLQLDEKTCELTESLVLFQEKVEMFDDREQQSKFSYLQMQDALKEQKERCSALEIMEQKAECQLSELHHCIDIQQDRVRLLQENEKKWQFHLSETEKLLTIEKEKVAELFYSLQEAEELIQGLEETAAVEKANVSGVQALFLETELRMAELESARAEAEGVAKDLFIALEKSSTERRLGGNRLNKAFGFCRLLLSGIVITQCIQRGIGIGVGIVCRLSCKCEKDTGEEAFE